MNTLTLQFNDPEDLDRVLKYRQRAKEQDGTVGGVWAGLVCSALKRSEIELSEDEMARRGALLAEAFKLKRSSHKGSDGKPDRWTVEGGDKTDLGLFRTVRRIIEEGQ